MARRTVGFSGDLDPAHHRCGRRPSPTVPPSPWLQHQGQGESVHLHDPAQETDRIWEAILHPERSTSSSIPGLSPISACSEEPHRRPDASASELTQQRCRRGATPRPIAVVTPQGRYAPGGNRGRRVQHFHGSPAFHPYPRRDSSLPWLPTSPDNWTTLNHYGS